MLKKEIVEIIEHLSKQLEYVQEDDTQSMLSKMDDDAQAHWKKMYGACLALLQKSNANEEEQSDLILFQKLLHDEVAALKKETHLLGTEQIEKIVSAAEAAVVGLRQVAQAPIFKEVSPISEKEKAISQTDPTWFEPFARNKSTVKEFFKEFHQKLEDNSQLKEPEEHPGFWATVLEYFTGNEDKKIKRDILNAQKRAVKQILALEDQSNLSLPEFYSQVASAYYQSTAVDFKRDLDRKGYIKELSKQEPMVKLLKSTKNNLREFYVQNLLFEFGTEMHLQKKATEEEHNHDVGHSYTKEAMNRIAWLTKEIIPEIFEAAHEYVDSKKPGIFTQIKNFFAGNPIDEVSIKIQQLAMINSKMIDAFSDNKVKVADPATLDIPQQRFRAELAFYSHLENLMASMDQSHPSYEKLSKIKQEVTAHYKAQSQAYVELKQENEERIPLEAELFNLQKAHQDLIKEHSELLEMNQSFHEKIESKKNIKAQLKTTIEVLPEKIKKEKRTPAQVVEIKQKKEELLAQKERNDKTVLNLHTKLDQILQKAHFSDEAENAWEQHLAKQKQTKLAEIGIEKLQPVTEEARIPVNQVAEEKPKEKSLSPSPTISKRKARLSLEKLREEHKQLETRNKIVSDENILLKKKKTEKEEELNKLNQEINDLEETKKNIEKGDGHTQEYHEVALSNVGIESKVNEQNLVIEGLKFKIDFINKIAPSEEYLMELGKRIVDLQAQVQDLKEKIVSDEDRKAYGESLAKKQITLADLKKEYAELEGKVEVKTTPVQQTVDHREVTLSRKIQALHIEIREIEKQLDYNVIQRALNKTPDRKILLVQSAEKRTALGALEKELNEIQQKNKMMDLREEKPDTTISKK